MRSIILPLEINLVAIPKIIKLTYEPAPFSFLDVKFLQEELIFRGGVKSHVKIQKILQQWLKVRAKLHLLPLLQDLSKETGLTYQQAQIRNQNTLWGSCSANQHISLNCKLLFLPHNLVWHILLHELCHTVHLNHSPQFWSLLKSFDENCHTHKKALKTAHLLVPSWA